jgi:hypothetical protein
MAYVNLTNIQQWAVGAEQKGINFHELNRLAAGAAKAGLDMAAAGMAPLPMDELTPYIKRFDDAPSIPVIVNDGVSITNTRVAVGTAVPFGTTNVITIVRNTTEASIVVVPDRHRGNAVALQPFLDAKLNLAAQAMLNAMDVTAVAALEAAKSQVGKSAYPFAFDAGADTYNVVVPAGVTDLATKNGYPVFFFEQLSAIQKAEKFLTPFSTIIGSPTMETTYQFSKRFADYNAENLQQQINKLTSYTSSNMSEVGLIGTGFALAPMSFGMYTWVSGDAREGFDNGVTRLAKQFIPQLGFEVEVLIESSLRDLTATFGATYARAVGEVIRLSVDYYTLVSYNSAPATVASPIMKFNWTQGV